MIYDYRLVSGNKALCLTSAISAPRYPTEPENTKPLRGAGALERTVRQKFTRLMRFVPHRILSAQAMTD